MISIKNMKLAAVIAIASLSVSCSSIKSFFGGGNSLESIAIECAADCNSRSAVALDIVFIMEKDIRSLLPNVSLEWFSKRGEYLAHYRDQVSIISIELPPGQSILEAPLPKDSSDAVTILVYAKYVSAKGQFVADISQYSQLQLRLEKDSYMMLELKK